MRIERDLEMRVASIVTDVAEAVLLPHFRQLRDDEIEEKSPGELVTVADRQSEALLSKRLLELLPGSRVVGEEAVAIDPSLLHNLGDGYVWLVDPLDGTSNFVAGRPEFAILVALLLNGRTVASWQYCPIPGSMCVAALGSGALINGVRVSITPETPVQISRLRGAIFSRFLPAHLKARVAEMTPAFGDILPGTKCAGFEYPSIAIGEQDFVLYWRLLPWDHAAGILFLEEAGGHVRLLDGSQYFPGGNREGLLAARSAAAWHDVRDAFTSAGQ